MVMSHEQNKNKQFPSLLFHPLVLTWLCVQAAAVEKVSSEDDVDVTEEQQDVSSFPCSGTHVQTSASGKLLVQVDHREITEIQLSESSERNKHYVILEATPSPPPSLIQVATPPLLRPRNRGHAPHIATELISE